MRSCMRKIIAAYSNAHAMEAARISLAVLMIEQVGNLLQRVGVNEYLTPGSNVHS